MRREWCWSTRAGHSSAGYYQAGRLTLCDRPLCSRTPPSPSVPGSSSPTGCLLASSSCLTSCTRTGPTSRGPSSRRSSPPCTRPTLPASSASASRPSSVEAVRPASPSCIYDDEALQKKFEPRHRLVRVRSSGLCIGYWHAADMPSPFDPSSVQPCRQGREGLAQAPQGAQESVQGGPRHQEGQGGRAGEEEVKGGRPPSSLRLFDWHGRLSHACARRFDRALHAGAPLAGGRSGDLNGTKKEWEDREGWSSGRLTMMMVSQSRCLTRLGYSRAEWCARYGQRRRRMSQYDTGGDPARENGA